MPMLSFVAHHAAHHSAAVAEMDGLANAALDLATGGGGHSMHCWTIRSIGGQSDAIGRSQLCE